MEGRKDGRREGWKAFMSERLPLEAVDRHLRKPLPKHINLLFSLGSLAMFLLLLQAVTGAFLALYYSPSPEHAHNAVTYISEEVPFGAFVRGLHHWGASAMVIIVFLHLLRVVLYGSYKAPRELTWILGVLLLLVVLGFGFTGYLLPWDEKAYWATVVGVEIASTAPVLGDFVAKVMRGGSEIGAVTLSRFYALHTIWLPWLAFGLVGVHLFFVRYYGSSGIPQSPSCPPDKGGRGVTAEEQPPSSPLDKEESPLIREVRGVAEIKTGKPFYPDQVFEDVIGMLILFAVLASVALFVPVPLEEVADPTNAEYDPRPEWYFLFLFQLLKYFQGPFEIIGTFVIPTVGMVLLLILPFLDKSERVVLWKRPIALTVTSVCVIGIVSLTILGASSPKLETQEPSQPTEQVQDPVTPDTETEVVEEGEEVFDFQLTEEEIEGTEEGEEVFDFPTHRGRIGIAMINHNSPEQFTLFPTDTESQPPRDDSTSGEIELVSFRELVPEIKDTGYLTHAIFAYPAKFIPQIVRYAITTYTKEGDWIVDPFAGSGTVGVEAYLCKRNAFLLDLNLLLNHIMPMKLYGGKERLREADLHKLLEGMKESKAPVYTRLVKC